MSTDELLEENMSSGFNGKENITEMASTFYRFYLKSVFELKDALLKKQCLLLYSGHVRGFNPSDMHKNKLES